MIFHLKIGRKKISSFFPCFSKNFPTFEKVSLVTLCTLALYLSLSILSYKNGQSEVGRHPVVLFWVSWPWATAESNHKVGQVEVIHRPALQDWTPCCLFTGAVRLFQPAAVVVDNSWIPRNPKTWLTMKV